MHNRNDPNSKDPHAHDERSHERPLSNVDIDKETFPLNLRSRVYRNSELVFYRIET